MLISMVRFSRSPLSPCCFIFGEYKYCKRLVSLALSFLLHLLINVLSFLFPMVDVRALFFNLSTSRISFPEFFHLLVFFVAITAPER